MKIKVDREKLVRWIDELAAISEAKPPAVTRVAFSDTDLRAREWIRERCREAGLEVREDAVGNLFARWVGTDPKEAAVATGSHIDAIPNAGRYDGTVGVLGGIEAICALQRAGYTPRRSLEVVMFTSEEPTRFGIGCLGSRLLVGALDPDKAAKLRDADGQTLDQVRKAAGFKGSLASVKLPEKHYHAFFELHIEQGTILEKSGVTLGMVERIAGPSSYRVTLEGEGGHAGSVLMPDRHDASLAAAEIALAVEKAALASTSPDTVATTGVFRIEPGAVNSVPAKAVLEIDLRDTQLEPREAVLAEIRKAAEEICQRRGIKMDFAEINSDPPGKCNLHLVAFTELAAGPLQIKSQRMISRAYHDSLFMARNSPTTMMFIPCKKGWSHRPDEYADPKHFVAGVTALAQVMAILSE